MTRNGTTSAALSAALLLTAGCARVHFVAPPDRGPRATIGELRDELDGLLEVRSVEGRCATQLADGRWVEVVALTGSWDSDPVLTTPLGHVSIDGWLLERDVSIDRLYALVERAVADRGTAAGAGADGRIDFHPLFGPTLVLDRVAVTADDLFARHTDPGLDARNAGLRATVEDAVAGLERGGRGLAPAERDAVVAVASRAADVDLSDDEMLDELPPDAVRRLIRAGWLREVFGDTPTASVIIDGRPAAPTRGPADRRARALETAVIAACAPHPAETWSDGAQQVLRFVDAFGRESWFRSTPSGNSLAVRPPLAEFGELDWDFPNGGWVVLDLERPVDPRGVFPVAAVTAARFYEDALEIASWTPDAGLVADPGTWRGEVPIETVVWDRSAVDDYLPPHLVLSDVHGDVRALVTAHGVLEPPRDRSGEETERFLADAARTLPDPAHLDLLGQYLVQYAFDGPTTARPEILGTYDIQGERHQTAAETLATCRGGICVGDCDDLTELYVDLMRRQGRRAFALGVPGHMFAAAAEPIDDGYAVHVLQTGLAETHRAAALADAVAAALRSQDPTTEPDTLRIEAWPRTDGGPVRTLTWIDADALASADAMDRVVRRARFEARGLWSAALGDRHEFAAATGAAASADARAAAHARLAEALAATGQFERAARDAMRAAELASTRGARIGQWTAALHSALAAADPEAIERAGTGLRAALTDASIDALPRAGSLLDAVDALLRAADGGAAASALAAELMPAAMRALQTRVEHGADDSGSALEVEPDEWVTADLLDSVAATAAQAARVAATDADRGALRDAVRDWVAFARRRDEFGVWSDHAPLLATLDRPDPKTFVQRLSKLTLPREEPDFAQRDADLEPWIAAQCITWLWELDERLAPGRPGAPADELKTITRGLARAVFARQATGDFDADDAYAQVFGKLVEGLVLGDPAAAGAGLRIAEFWVPDRLAELGAELARLAPRAEADAFVSAVDNWLDTDGRADDAFTLVWATRAAGAGGHALRAADLVCDRFPADRGFADERERLRAMR